MKRLAFLVLAAAFALGGPALAAPPTPSPDVRLYALDCGQAVFTDLGPFSDTGEYDGHPGTLQASCFLIRHPKGDLLWDAGLGDRYAATPGGAQLPRYKAVVTKTLESQLAAIGLAYGDIDYFAFSHGHGDHLGNANALGAATWIVNRKELAWIESTPAPPRTDAKLVAARDPAKTVLIDGDHDVFGDGSVRILATPGHTPGHAVLLVSLRKTGPVLLSGDLFHSHANRQGRRMPVFNVNRADTLASIDRVEAIVRNRHARVVIQHAPEDLKALPAAPGFLD
ncbi:MAG TPA: N-acyl homoserine lactonase family protein [Caulobacter sp.]|nr:N-acyl homoserine lactonase family protein [Caulobacter sp.]